MTRSVSSAIKGEQVTPLERGHGSGSKIPLLTIDEERALGKRAFRGEKRAQEELARRNVRFVVSVAKQYQNRGVPLMDLIGEGNLGLLTAARKFDPERGVKFISYAVWWVRQAIQAAIARHGRTVRLPLNRTADANRLAFPDPLWSQRLPRADPATHAVAVAACRDMVTQGEQPTDVVRTVETMLRERRSIRLRVHWDLIIRAV